MSVIQIISLPISQLFRLLWIHTFLIPYIQLVEAVYSAYFILGHSPLKVIVSSSCGHQKVWKPAKSLLLCMYNFILGAHNVIVTSCM